MSKASRAWMAAALTWRAEVLLLAAQAATISGNGNGLADKLSSGRAKSEAFNRHLVLFSGLFNRDYYLSVHPDVASSTQDPLDHYLNFGGVEGRNPSEFFNAALYLSSYEDVRTAGVNPLVHFIKFGVVEGREAGAPDSFPSPLESSEASTLRGVYASSNGIVGLNGLTLHGASSAVASFVAEFNSRQSYLESHIGRLQEGVGQWEALAHDRDDLERKLYIANSALHRSTADIEALRTEAEQWRAERAELAQKAEVERAALEGQLTLSHQERDDLARRLYAANSDLHRATAAVDRLENSLLKIEAESGAELATLRVKAELQNAELERLKAEERRLAQMRAELDDAKSQILVLQSELEHERSAGHSSSLVVEELREARASLESRLQGLSESTSDRHQVDALLEAVRAATATPEVLVPELNNIRDAAISILRWPLEVSASNEFDAELFQNFVYKLLLASRTVEDGNLDTAYSAFSHFMNSEEANKARVQFLLFVIANWPRLAAVYHKLGNDASKTLFLQLLMFRTLGHQHVKLASNTPEYWEMKKWSNDLPEMASSFSSVEGGGNLRLFRVRAENREIELECLHANMFFTFGVNQYYYQRDGVTIAPAAGDHVIDAGTCFGDTAVRMALSVGTEGAIYSFDPVHVHQTIAASNARRNKLNNVHFVPFGLSDRKRDAEASDSGVNPGYTVGAEPDVPLTTIDALVEDGTVRRVDFIKMDIEGSELAALRGAEKALRTYKPKLAISIYHKWEDYFSIAEYILSLDLGYRIYMDNYTVCEGETILYCLAGA